MGCYNVILGKNDRSYMWNKLYKCIQIDNVVFRQVFNFSE